MTDKEMTDLDVWIAINLFGYVWTYHPDDSTVDDVKQVWRTEKKDVCVVSHTWQYGVETNDVKRFNHQWNNFQPTRDAADAFKVLRKLNELVNERKLRHDIRISTVCGDPWVRYESVLNITSACEETLEMAICVFAKKMFLEI
jgi:hypothetical protein